MARITRAIKFYTENIDPSWKDWERLTGTNGIKDGYLLTTYASANALAITVLSVVSNEDGSGFGRLLAFYTRDGQIRQEYVKDVDLFNKNVLATFRDFGYAYANADVADQLQKSILATNVSLRIFKHDSKGFSGVLDYYIFPDGAISRTGIKEIFYENNDLVDKALTVSGTLEDWQQYVFSKCVGNNMAIFVIIYALATALLPFINMSTVFFHLFGLSSRGKTTLLQLFASVYGNGSDPSQSTTSLITSWNSTAAGLEGKAQHYNGVVAPFDELDSADDKSFGKSIYAINNGLSKLKATPFGTGMQRQHSWLFHGLSSGELSSREKIEKSGVKVNKGQGVRFIDLEITDNEFPETHGMPIREFIGSLKTNSGKYFGPPARNFITQLLSLTNDTDELKQLIRERLDAEMILVAKLDLPPEQNRLIERFALIQLAGKLAVEFKVLPFQTQEIEQSVAYVMDRWLFTIKKHSDINNYQEILKKFLQDEISCFSVDLNLNRKKCLGFIKKTGGKEYFLIKPGVFKELFEKHSLSDVYDDLIKADILEVGKNRPTKLHSIACYISDSNKRGQTRFYTVRAKAIHDTYQDNNEAQIDS